MPTPLLLPSQSDVESAGAAGGSAEQPPSHTTFSVESASIFPEVWLKNSHEDTAVGHFGALLPPRVGCSVYETFWNRLTKHETTSTSRVSKLRERHNPAWDETL